MWPDKISTTGIGVDQRVILYTGHSCAVQDVKPGMQLLGPDSKPRAVTSTHTGLDWLYRCDTTAGSDSFIASARQVLSLNRRSVIRYSSKGMWHKPQTELVSIQDYKNRTHSFQEAHRTWRPIATFPVEKEYGFREAYELGLQAIKTGELEHANLLTSVANRKELIAGILDAGGKLRNVHWREYSFAHQSRQLVEALAFLLRSIDVGVYMHLPSQKLNQWAKGRLIVYNCLPTVPFRKLVARAHRMKRVRPSRSRLLIRPLEEGCHYGFTLTGDQLYMLSDFTVLCAAAPVL